MKVIDEADVLRRAKELCQQDGTKWDVEFTPVKPGSFIRYALDEEGRREYLTRAREQLLKEAEKRR